MNTESRTIQPAAIPIAIGSPRERLTARTITTATIAQLEIKPSRIIEYCRFHGSWGSPKPFAAIWTSNEIKALMIQSVSTCLADLSGVRGHPQLVQSLGRQWGRGARHRRASSAGTRTGYSHRAKVWRCCAPTPVPKPWIVLQTERALVRRSRDHLSGRRKHLATAGVSVHHPHMGQFLC